MQQTFVVSENTYRLGWMYVLCTFRSCRSSSVFWIVSDSISLHLVASMTKAKTCDGLDFRCVELEILDWSEPDGSEETSRNGAAS